MESVNSPGSDDLFLLPHTATSKQQAAQGGADRQGGRMAHQAA